MTKAIAMIVGVCILGCAALFLLPFLLAFGLLGLLLTSIVAGAELAVIALLAMAAVVAIVVMMHLFIPLLVPLLLVCGIVYLFKHFGKSVA